MKLKKGDKVIVITGSHKGKTGQISQVFPGTNRVAVEGVNVMKVRSKSRARGTAPQVVERALPFNASNVMILDPKKNVRTRIGSKKIGDKNIRVTKKSGSELK